jgi:hypothetical protein
MRSIILLTLASINIALLTACTTIGPARLDDRYSVSECSPLEGYPDCQDGQLARSNPVTDIARAK